MDVSRYASVPAALAPEFNAVITAAGSRPRHVDACGQETSAFGVVKRRQGQSALPTGISGRAPYPVRRQPSQLEQMGNIQSWTSVAIGRLDGSHLSGAHEVQGIAIFSRPRPFRHLMVAGVEGVLQPIHMCHLVRGEHDMLQIRVQDHAASVCAACVTRQAPEYSAAIHVGVEDHNDGKVVRQIHSGSRGRFHSREISL